MKPIYKILLFLILIITITIYFYTNRYETHIIHAPDTTLRVWSINKWSGEVLVCCGGEGGGWMSLGIPKKPRLRDMFTPIDPTPTN